MPQSYSLRIVQYCRLFNIAGARVARARGETPIEANIEDIPVGEALDYLIYRYLLGRMKHGDFALRLNAQIEQSRR